MTRMVQTMKLPNGLHIVTERIPFVRSVAFGIWVRNGSRNENVDTMGMSHFIEHLFFKGTHRRSAADIAEEMDAIGGQLNAYTTKEFTCYYTLSLDTHFYTALDVLADMFFNSKFDDADIKKELNVIIEEINMYEDTPEELVHDLLQASIWRKDPLGYPILGEEATISTFDNGMFRTFYNERYRPENTVVAVAGNFDADEVVKKIESYFGGFRRVGDYARESYETVYTPAVVAREKDIEQVHLSFGFPGVAIGSAQSYTATVLNTIFGSGMSSRLFQTIREEHGLAYAVYSYNASFTDTGLFTVYAGLGPSQTERVVSLVLGEIKRLRTDRITNEQVAKTKEQLKSNYFLSLESSTSRMNSMGKSQLMLNRILRPEDVVEKIDAVTLDGVYELVESIFDMDKMSLAAVGPVADMDFTEMLRS